MRDAAPVASPSMGAVFRGVMSMPAVTCSGVRIKNTKALVARVVNMRRDSGCLFLMVCRHDDGDDDDGDGDVDVLQVVV